MPSSALFETIPEKDYMALFPGKDKVDSTKVLDALGLKKNDVSKAAGIPVNSVRFDEKMPKVLKERLIEWAILLNFVAQHFGGNPEKTVFWFKISNPLLGDVTPRDMIRFGRSKKLLNFILSALRENK